MNVIQHFYPRHLRTKSSNFDWATWKIWRRFWNHKKFSVFSVCLNDQPITSIHVHVQITEFSTELTSSQLIFFFELHNISCEAMMGFHMDQCWLDLIDIRLIPSYFGVQKSQSSNFLHFFYRKIFLGIGQFPLFIHGTYKYSSARSGQLF